MHTLDSPSSWKDPLLRKNPILVDFIGLCPVLATTTTLYNALGMGVGTAFVLVCSALIASLVRHWVPREVRIPSHILIIAALTGSLDLLMRAYTPQLSASLGAFIPLIVVNCLILGEIESFASRCAPLPSLIHALLRALGFVFALVLVAAVRELLGSGTLSIGPKILWPYAIKLNLGGLRLLLHNGTIHTPLSGEIGGRALLLFALPAGALLVVGYLSALFAALNHLLARRTQASVAYPQSAAARTRQAVRKAKA